MELFVLILFLFLSGLTCGTIASDKGRSKADWFFIGLFSGIFGIIMVACMSRRPAKGANAEGATSAIAAITAVVLFVSVWEPAVAASDNRPSAGQLISRLTHPSCLYLNLRYEPTVRVCSRDIMRPRSSANEVHTEISAAGGLPGDKWSWIEVAQEWDTGSEIVRVALLKRSFVGIPRGEPPRYAFTVQRYWSGAGFDNPACQYKCIAYSNGPGSTAGSNWNDWVTSATLTSAMHAIRAGLARDRSASPCTGTDHLWELQLQSDGTVNGRCIERE